MYLFSSSSNPALSLGEVRCFTSSVSVPLFFPWSVEHHPSPEFCRDERTCIEADCHAR